MPDTNLMTLSIADYADAWHWRWVLTDANGAFAAGYEVQLDAADPHLTAFLNLRSYVEARSIPGSIGEETLTHEVGAWVTRCILGGIASTLVECHAELVVVSVPLAAKAVAYRPLDLAIVNERTLSAHGITFVYDIGTTTAPTHPSPRDGPIRVLAIFSLPVTVAVLDLRRERYELKNLLKSIAVMQNAAIEIKTIQYGANRKALADIAEEGDGWDVVHFSGHGITGALVLEQDDGEIDVVPAMQMVDLLAPLRNRVRLVTLAACYSGATEVDATLRWLNLEMRRDESPSERESLVPNSLASRIIDAFDCAVVAMRYAVEDEFAITFITQLYDRLFRQRQVLWRAVHLTQRELRQNPEASPLSLATPALFGRAAIKTRFDPPARRASFSLSATAFAYFPPEPVRFVGRTATITKAARALARNSTRTAICLDGMTGAGKTTCAAEIAYLYADATRFEAFVWYRVSTDDPQQALLAFARALEAQLPGFSFADAFANPEQLRALLPRLTELLDQRSILLVIDNLEPLLTSSGAWRDPVWSEVVDALIAHGGLSRVIFTSRLLFSQARKPNTAVERIPIHALSLPESVLLARQLPNLGALFRQQDDDARLLVLHILRFVQGHPKLIELVEGQASDVNALAQSLHRIEADLNRPEQILLAFLETGESQLDSDRLMQSLRHWSATVIASVSPAARLLLETMCVMDENDRNARVLGFVWPKIAKAPSDQLFAELTASILCVEQGPHPYIVNARKYDVHPVIINEVLSGVTSEFVANVENNCADFWLVGIRRGIRSEAEGGGRLLTYSAQSAIPYLIRRERWSDTAWAIGLLLDRDISPDVISEILTVLRGMMPAISDPETSLAISSIYAQALAYSPDRAAAESELRKLLRDHVAAERWALASVVGTFLSRLLIELGRPEEALALMDDVRRYTRLGNMGRWGEIDDEGQIMLLHRSLGDSAKTLEMGKALLQELANLSDAVPAGSYVLPWKVRERVLHETFLAAVNEEEWSVALAVQNERMRRLHERGAPELEIVRRQSEGYHVLIALEQIEEAGALLQHCREFFEQANDVEFLTQTYLSIADYHYRLHDLTSAVRFAKAALALAYTTGQFRTQAAGHYNLASYQRMAGAPRDEWFAHRLAAAILGFMGGHGDIVSSVLITIRPVAGQIATPPPLEWILQRIERTEGVGLRTFLTNDPARLDTAMEALRVMWAHAASRLEDAVEGSREDDGTIRASPC